VLEQRADGIHILDQGSLNGTYVNRERVEDARLADGDELQIGKYRLAFIEH
jgi:pSer/pThr/pTyr-binding forkhead associated (FHA) protein